MPGLPPIIKLCRILHRALLHSQLILMVEGSGDPNDDYDDE